MSVQNGTFTRTQSFTPEKDGIVPRFYIESVDDPVATQAQGRPICFDQERVEMMIPGNVLNVKVDIVNDTHRQRWPEAYDRFRKGQEMAANGTPLEMWPILKPSMVREIKHFNLFTVEHVRDMDDRVAQQLMGGMKLRQLAKAYLDDAAAQALLTKATADNEKKDLEISDLRRQLEELRSLMTSMHGEIMAQRNAPHPLQVQIPGMSDPIEQMKQGQQQPVAQSALSSLPDAPRRRGRPPSNEAAA